ncbi:hypothetical protein [Pseudomonas sp. dw_358]|uniref:hypothetical protein n=1 Tax=Pseudomonas sp. dw_358 TaxID=2720083 RepID=UPI001BD1F300|nr:hypothetical protein [Pseudomonas sp. dw_358]
MALAWPTMAPAGEESSRLGTEFRGLELMLSRRTPSGSSRPKAMVDDFLMSSHKRFRENAAFYPSLGLFGATENKGLSKGGSSMFWGSHDEQGDVVFICNWERSETVAPRCAGTFLIPVLTLKIKVEMAPETLPDWRVVVQKVTKSVVAHGRLDEA